jgi:molecular chaperone GrpE
MSASTDDLNPEVDVDKSEPVVVDEVASEDPLATLTNDLQRLQAEYANYRKRVERDRELVKDLAVASVLSELLGTLDDLDRARAHDELSGGFKAVADQLENLTTKLGLEKYGTEGEVFDPMIHEALVHNTSSEVSETTATAILQPGYRFKDRILRPARVAVTEPEA